MCWFGVSDKFGSPCEPLSVISGQVGFENSLTSYIFGLDVEDCIVTRFYISFMHNTVCYLDFIPTWLAAAASFHSQLTQ